MYVPVQFFELGSTIVSTFQRSKPSTGKLGNLPKAVHKDETYVVSAQGDKRFWWAFPEKTPKNSQNKCIHFKNFLKIFNSWHDDEELTG